MKTPRTKGFEFGRQTADKECELLIGSASDAQELLESLILALIPIRSKFQDTCGLWGLAHAQKELAFWRGAIDGLNSVLQEVRQDIENGVAM